MRASERVDGCVVERRLRLVGEQMRPRFVDDVQRVGKRIDDLSQPCFALFDQPSGLGMLDGVGDPISKDRLLVGTALLR